MSYIANQNHVWLPYTQMKYTSLPLEVIAAQKCNLLLKDGTKLIDGLSNWWSACHGHSHPYIICEVTKQLKTLSHIMFAGLAHEQSYKLAARLVQILPKGLTRVFFSDSGSTAVEVAMKIAVQYFHNIGQPDRNNFIFFKNSYHGDTMGCMSVSDSFHGPIFKKYHPAQYMLEIPNNEKELSIFNEKVADLKESIAGIIIEPILQAAGGMKIHSASMLNSIFNIAKDHNILFIADEIATGFGRIGTMFACQEAKITPDIITVGKALTGGICTLAATIVTDQIFNAFLSESMDTALMHGPTFMANPLACAAANASLDLFDTEPRIEQVHNIERILKSEFEKFKSLGCIKNIRVKGAVGIIEIEKHISLKSITKKCIAKGIWIRPIGNVIYIMPPFIITDEELIYLIDAIFQIVSIL